MIINHNSSSSLIGAARKMEKALNAMLERADHGLDRDELLQISRKIEHMKLRAQMIKEEQRQSIYEKMC
jgi:hypothetical protein